MTISKISLLDSSFPTLLRQIADPPKQLYIRTLNLAGIFDGPCLAVVGSRAATSYGRQVTHDLATRAARAGVTIVSGLALGIDSIAHRGALEAGGRTIAVLPTGLNRIYPSSHRRLAQQIVEQGGALVSEYESSDAPQKYRFIARNRIIAGLCQATLVTQAAARSGSLHTAAFALDYNRLVLAVPGNITSPGSAGTNQLLRSHATPITSIHDILDEFGLTAAQKQSLRGDNPAQQQLLDLLAAGDAKTGTLLQSSQLSVPEFNQTLTILEIQGKIRPLGGDQWQLSSL